MKRASQILLAMILAGLFFSAPAQARCLDSVSVEALSWQPIARGEEVAFSAQATGSELIFTFFNAGTALEISGRRAADVEGTIRAFLRDQKAEEILDVQVGNGVVIVQSQGERGSHYLARLLITLL